MPPLQVAAKKAQTLIAEDISMYAGNARIEQGKNSSHNGLEFHARFPRFAIRWRVCEEARRIQLTSIDIVYPAIAIETATSICVGPRAVHARFRRQSSSWSMGSALIDNTTWLSDSTRRWHRSIYFSSFAVQMKMNCRKTGAVVVGLGHNLTYKKLG